VAVPRAEIGGRGIDQRAAAEEEVLLVRADGRFVFPDFPAGLRVEAVTAAVAVGGEDGAVAVGEVAVGPPVRLVGPGDLPGRRVEGVDLVVLAAGDAVEFKMISTQRHREHGEEICHWSFVI